MTGFMLYKPVLIRQVSLKVTKIKLCTSTIVASIKVTVLNSLHTHFKFFKNIIYVNIVDNGSIIVQFMLNPCLHPGDLGEDVSPFVAFPQRTHKR